MSDAVLSLTRELIARPSVTPEDAGCQNLLAERLTAAGFRCEELPFGRVSNLWATHGTGGPLLVFAGHTDVVPTGPVEQWRSEPFVPEIRDGMLYGRGAADMKGSLAAMLVACERFLEAHPDHAGRIGLLITSDEEGPATEGTRRVMEHLNGLGEKIDWCLVGEPSCRERLGDTLRRGRRGSLSGMLTIKGVQGHVAYPDQAENPIHRALPALTALCGLDWDEGHPDFPATGFQISNIHAGTGANNVIPGTLEVLFNLRYCPASTPESLQRKIENTLARHKLDFTIAWHDSGRPFHTPDGNYLSTVAGAVQEVLGIQPELSTGGGTSDGRFIAPYGAQVVELGPVNATIHKIDECVRVADLEPLAAVYQRILEKLLA